MQSDGDDEHFSVETERLILRRPLPGDAGQIAGLADNLAVAQNLATMPHPYGLADAEAWIAKTGTPGEGPGARVIELHGTGTVIGACGVMATERGDGLELGYWLGEPYWHRGYATETALAMIDLAFADPSLPHLWCSCRVTNEASRRVIQKCGFQYHGAGLMHCAALGAALAVEHYCLDRDLWTGLGRRRPPRPAAAECRA